MVLWMWNCGHSHFIPYNLSAKIRYDSMSWMNRALEVCEFEMRRFLVIFGRIWSFPIGIWYGFQRQFTWIANFCLRQRRFKKPNVLGLGLTNKFCFSRESAANLLSSSVLPFLQMSQICTFKTHFQIKWKYSNEFYPKMRFLQINRIFIWTK